MQLKELYRLVNDKRISNNLPTITAERFLEEITYMQLIGKVEIVDNNVYSL